MVRGEPISLILLLALDHGNKSVHVCGQIIIVYDQRPQLLYKNGKYALHRTADLWNDVFCVSLVIKMHLEEIAYKIYFIVAVCPSII